MMVMNKHFILTLAAALCLLPACREDKTAGQPSSESTVVVKLTRLPLQKEIDWNLEIATLDGGEVLAKAAARAGTDLETLDQATSLRVDLEAREILITARHENGETSREYAEALAGAYEEVRKLLEKRIEDGELARLAGDREELSKLIEAATLTDLDPDASPRDQDRMTYEKARKALEENPIPDDGILYRKEDKE